MVFSPFKKILSFTFRFVLVPLYDFYRKIKKIIRKIFLPAKNTFLYPLVSKHLALTVLILLGLAVSVNNLSLKDAHAEQYGKKSIIASINYNEDADIEEEIVGRPTKAQTVFASLVTPAQAAPLQTTSITSEQRTENVVSLALAGGTVTTTAKVSEYLVAGGDTVSTIAEQFNVSTQTILWANGMGEFDFIKPGQKLKIPPVSGVVHTIASGDSIGAVARKYGVSEDSILEYNRLADASLIETGQTLIVPGGKPPAPPAPVRTTTPSTTSYASVPPSANVSTSTRFIWPTPSRRINQYFGYRHTGLDIDGDYSSPIYAAAGGVVTTVSYIRYGYGYHVIIRHPDGAQTLYSHASKIFVSPGQTVNQGQTIAMVGTTGRSTGTHLHFEIIIGGRKMNPLGYIR